MSEPTSKVSHYNWTDAVLAKVEHGATVRRYLMSDGADGKRVAVVGFTRLADGAPHRGAIECVDGWEVALFRCDPSSIWPPADKKLNEIEPGVLANALHDRIHPTSGKLISASPVVRAIEMPEAAYARGVGEHEEKP